MKTSTFKTVSTSVETQIILEAAEKWAELPSRTIARKVLEDNKDIFRPDCLDKIRSRVRYMRGQLGAIHRKSRKSMGGILPQTTPHVAFNPLTYIPPSSEEEFLPYVVVTGLTRDAKIDVLGDLHFPYHSPTALKVVLDRMDRDRPDILLLNGDIMDFYQLSRFMKDPRKNKPEVEVELVNTFLDALAERFPKTRIIWKDGNHDERFDHYLMNQAPLIYNMAKEFMSLEKVLDLAGRGIEYVSDKRPIYAGKLTILHGHEYPTPVLGPVNAARGAYLRAKSSVMVHHHHQISEHSEPSVRGKWIGAWSVGCLCDLHPEYARFNKWGHGYARVRLARDNSFQVHNHTIFGDRLLN